ncbi:hypothetical protein GOP47_0022688 [Adiantum capillus-veneris]|uniref:Alpha-D-phosphohexomutase alpha/beta/alpha domain-containing protein n=1 Tax=Adiantum capillus-veneris TaxID=13818 RepID=A0A9D4U5U7_ADICA|nr:hypothetical protein GOP47_0022688 [Adiantum capillus-veneris]
MELDPDRLLTAAAARQSSSPYSLSCKCFNERSMTLLFCVGVHFAYGTAGFRADASILDCAVFRAGIVAALHSLHTSSTIGLMITASHKPIQDNGVKIADYNGDMLCQDWEPFSESFANAHNPHDVLQVILDFIHKGNFFNSAASSGRASPSLIGMNSDNNGTYEHVGGTIVL